MSGRSSGLKVATQPPAGSRCLLILQRCLAIQLHKAAIVRDHKKSDRSGSREELHSRNTEFWMYDSGYLLFQGFLEANLKCFWNSSLLEAMKLLEFQGYVAPGVLLVTASACALEVIRAAWARNVLKPPNNYIIAVVGDIEDCIVQPLPQGQFTPLSEALCWVILDLTSSGQAAVLDKIRTALQIAFPDMQKPPQEVVYDALAKLMVDRKIYQTSQGYFIVTPEKKRRDSTHTHHSRRHSHSSVPQRSEASSGRPMLMSTEEALTFMHGEMQTIRDGDITHQLIQTNLADVICGGNPNDKILYPRTTKRSSSFPTVRLERRYSLRFFGSSKRSCSPMNRSGSIRHIGNKNLTISDCSSSTEYPVTDLDDSPKKSSLLARLFRRNASKHGSPSRLATFSAQFPPTEWFNPRVVHLHSIATQTKITSRVDITKGQANSEGAIVPWTDEEGFTRAATLPRRHRRHTSGDSAISIATGNRSHTIDTTISTPRSHRRHRSPSGHSSTLPRRSNSASSKRGSLSQSSVVQPTSPLMSLPSTHSCIEKATLKSQSCKTSSLGKLTVGRTGNTGSKSAMENKSHCAGTLDVGKSSTSSTAQQTAKTKTSPPQTESGRKSRNAGSFQSSGAGNKERQSNKGPSVSDRAQTVQATLPKYSTMPSLLNGGNKSSITLQVSTSTHDSPPSSSGYSSLCQCSNGRGSVLSNTSAVPYHECAKGSFGVTAESQDNGNQSVTTTTTVNGTNAKIFIQQENSPVRSVITFENSTNSNDKENAAPQPKDYIILSSNKPTKESSKSSKSEKTGLLLQQAAESIAREQQKHQRSKAATESSTQDKMKLQRPHAIKESAPDKLKLQRPTFLYNREEPKSKSSEKHLNEQELLERIPLLSASEDSNSEETQDNMVSNMVSSLNSLNSGSNTLTSNNNADTSLDDCCSGGLLSGKLLEDLDIATKSMMHLPSTSMVLHDPTMNNTRIFQKQSPLPTQREKSKESLNYKNLFKNGPSTPVESSSAYTACGGKNLGSNPPSPTKSFDGFGGSNGNLFIDELQDNKFTCSSQELYCSTKSIAAKYKAQGEEQQNGMDGKDSFAYASLSDLTVLHYKSITAQKILKGISINSIDTLVEVNMAAAEKQNNCEMMTYQTDFGMV